MSEKSQGRQQQYSGAPSPPQKTAGEVAQVKISPKSRISLILIPGGPKPRLKLQMSYRTKPFSDEPWKPASYVLFDEASLDETLGQLTRCLEIIRELGRN